MFYYKLSENAELRLLEPSQAEDVFSLIDNSRNHLREWLPWVDSTKELNDSKNFIRGAMKQFADNNGFQAGIWYKGELAGIIGLHRIDWSNQSTSIGYWLGGVFQGEGLITTSCKAIIDYCFNNLNLKRIEIRTAVKNEKSQKIPERLGFQKEGCLRKSEFLYDRYVDHYIYSLINEETIQN